MYFKEIIDEFNCGKNIRRASWPIGIMIDRNNYSDVNIKDLLADDWQVIEGKNWWEPKEDEEDLYYIINDGVDYCFYNNDDTDQFLMAIGNCFQTEEQAKFMIEKLKVIHELRKFAYQQHGGKINWYDKNQEKFFVAYNLFNKKVEVAFSYRLVVLPFQIYFDSEEIARKAIETIGEDRIKKYYFGVNEDEEN